MEIERLKELVSEIERLQKAESLLHEVYVYTSPYDKEINGRPCKDLFTRISEHFGFDDSE